MYRFSPNFHGMVKYGLLSGQRIPVSSWHYGFLGWCDSFTLQYDGQTIHGLSDNDADTSVVDFKRIVRKDGYLYISGFDQEEETITLDFPMEPQWIVANPAVREDAGKVALQRGPIVYCLEEKDNGADLHLLSVDPTKQPVSFDMKIQEEEVIALKAQGQREIQDSSDPDAQSVCSVCRISRSGKGIDRAGLCSLLYLGEPWRK